MPKKTIPKKKTGEVVEQKREFRKHVAAIHTSGELSLLQRKIVNVLLLQAYDNLKTSNRHSLSVAMLCGSLGWDEGRDLPTLKEALLKIVSTPLEMNLLEASGERWTASTLLAQAEIENGVCTWEYSSRLAERLANPDIYAVINIGIQNLFKGGYSLTLYENCVRFRNTGSTGWIDLGLFRKIMGADKPTYDDFKRLSSFVIKNAVAEINALSDINISVEYQRDGRKVNRIRFKVEENKQSSIFDIESTVDQEELKKSTIFKRLLSHGVSEKLAIVWILQDKARAGAVVDYVEDKSRNNQVRGSTAGYIRTLIESEAAVGKTSFDTSMEADRLRKKEETDRLAAKAKKQEDESAKRDVKIKDAIAELTTDERRNFSRLYVEGDGAAFCKSYQKDTGTFKAAQERVLFTAWLRKQIADELFS